MYVCMYVCIYIYIYISRRQIIIISELVIEGIMQIISVNIIGNIMILLLQIILLYQ